jgi:hypothetical protein
MASAGSIMPIGLQQERARAHLERLGFSGDFGAALDVLDSTLHLDENLKRVRETFGLRLPEEMEEGQRAAEMERRALEIMEQGPAAVVALLEEVERVEARAGRFYDEGREAKREARELRAVIEAQRPSDPSEVEGLRTRCEELRAALGNLAEEARALRARVPTGPVVPWSAFSRVVAIAEAYGARVPFDLLTDSNDGGRGPAYTLPAGPLSSPGGAA